MPIVLVYEPGPGQGPEVRQLGSPFNCTVQPGLPFATEEPEWAAELVRRVPQIRVVSGAPYPGWPEPPASTADRLIEETAAQLVHPDGTPVNPPEVPISEATPEPILPEAPATEEAPPEGKHKKHSKGTK